MATGDFLNGSGLTGSILAQSVLTTSAVTPLYTVPVSPPTYVKIAKVIFTATSASATTVTYGAVKVGGTPGADGTLQGKAVPLGAAGSLTAVLDATELEGMMLGPGDFIAASASAGTAVTYTISGAVSA